MKSSAALIGELVKIFKPNDEIALEHAVNIMKSFSFNAPKFSKNVFQTRWISSIYLSGKIEDAQKIQRDIEIIKNVKNADNLFYLLDLLSKANKTALPKQLTMTDESLFKEELDQIPPDYLNVLQGLSGDSFFWSIKDQKFICKDEPTPHMFSITKKIGEIGQMVKYLNEFQNSINSLIFQKAFIAVQDILEEHLSNVMAITDSLSTMTITEFTLFLRSETIENLRAATIICNTIYRLKGGVLYNKLSSLTGHGDCSIHRVAQRMTKLAFEMIEEMIREWITSGDIIDTFEEFFIQSNGTYLSCSKWWQEKYSLVKEEIPNTLTQQQVIDIFETGKIINFFRIWNHAVKLDVDKQLPLNEYIAESAEKANTIIVKLLMDNNLNTVIHDIYDYVLLERGDFAYRFLALDDDAKNIQLGSIAQEIAKHPIHGFDLKISNSKWSFSYQIDPPLSVILTEDMMAAYYAVSSILLSLKRTEFKITRCRMMNKDSHDFCSVIFQMIHFINLVLDYFHQQIIKRSFQTLNERIAKAEKIDEIIEAFRIHKNEIVRGCWCSKSGREPQLALKSTLSAIEAVVDSDEPLSDCLDDFNHCLVDFREATRNHKAGGCELARSLTRLFSNILS